MTGAGLRRRMELLLVAFVLVVFWIGTWGVLEEWLTGIEQRTGATKMELYTYLVVLAGVFFVAFPEIMERV